MTSTRSLIRRLAPALLTLVALAVPGHAAASSTQETGMADDRILGADFGTASAAAADWAAMGIDTGRIIIGWSTVSPGQDDKRPPAGFDPSDPNDPGYNWVVTDQEVALLKQNGITPIISVTGPGPVWTSSKPSLGNAKYKPSPKRFGQFASAVAKRYGGDVSRYIVWNEPNLPDHLQPQFSCKRKRCTPEAPSLYRELFRSGAAALRDADPGAEVYAGALAPRGSDATGINQKVRPLLFIRSLACVTDRYKRDRTGSCRHAKPITADAFSYHPHAVISSPTTHSRNHDDASIADLPRLEKALDRSTKAGILKPVSGSRLDLELTEFGYQTNPPDAYSGVSTTQQMDWVQQSTYIAYKDPRVRNITQYEYIDEPIKDNRVGTNPFASWQSGLFFANGRPKALLAAFPNPFFVQHTGQGRSTFWGQVRPGEAHTVTLQRLQSSDYVDVQTVQTDAQGFFSVPRKVGSAGEYRYAYDGAPAPDGTPTTRYSVRVMVRP